MPIYEYECAHGRRHEEFFPMGEAPTEIDGAHAVVSMGVPDLRLECCWRRVFGNFNFVEDRVRLYRNPRTGTRFSDVLGCEMPDDRVSRDALYAQKGIEPVSPSEMPSQWKTALDYANYLKAGGKKLDRAEEAKLIEPPDLSGVKSIRQMMNESGYRSG